MKNLLLSIATAMSVTTISAQSSPSQPESYTIDVRFPVLLYQAMKHLFILAFPVMLLSCNGGQNEEAIKVAEKYVVENLALLFEGATVVNEYPGMVGGPVQYIDDAVVKAKIVNIHEKSLLDSKDWYAKYYLGGDSEETFKKELIKNAIKQSEIQALKDANATTGFYDVTVAIKYGEKDYQTFDIIVSKGMKVLNKPIDLSKIDDIIKSAHSN